MSLIQFDRYEHTQRGPWGLMCYGFAAAALAASITLPADASIPFLFTGLVLTLLGASFAQLTVEDRGDLLAVHFGPVPLFRKRIRYEDILEVEKGRSRFLDGWGIHWSPWGGWIWNVWGYDCVVLHLKRGRFRVGTNDAENLVELLKERTGETG